MNERGLPFLIMALLLLSAGVLLLTGRFSGDEPPQGSPPSAPSVTLLESPFVLPSVSADEISRAVAILASDLRAAALMGSTPYSIIDSGAAIDKNQNKFGVAMRISMSEPISVEGAWPQFGGGQLILSACSAPGGVTELIAVVDLVSGELGSLSIGPGHPVRSERGGVLRFSYDCDNVR